VVFRGVERELNPVISSSTYKKNLRFMNCRSLDKKTYFFSRNTSPMDTNIWQSKPHKSRGNTMQNTTRNSLLAISICAVFNTTNVSATTINSDARLPKSNGVWENDLGHIKAGDQTFLSWAAYFQSDFYKEQRGRCGALSPNSQQSQTLWGNTGDCTNSYTNPSSAYDPNGGLYRIPVVVHVITRTNGTGYISDAMVQSQIDVLNEDFQALPGSLGSPGTDCALEFYLATTDPDGNSTSGITRSTSNSWYNDHGNYKNALSWDTNKYLNMYTNTAGGYLGYAYIPNGGGVVGSNLDGVVINWQAFGRNSPMSPYHLGRTTTHEVGHYLGLFHTFQGGCASASGCNSNGDLICDTNPESGPNYSGCWSSSCGSTDPVKNYMDYSEDLCMDNFTPYQARRMRCTTFNWRFNLWAWDNGGGSDPVGACCTGTDCNEITNDVCLASGGTYEGNNSSCVSTLCNDTGGGNPIDATPVGAYVQTGTSIGGSWSNVDASDNAYYSIGAAKMGSQYECSVDITFVAASTTASRIDLRTEIGASVSGLKTKIYVYNHTNGSWKRIIQYNQGTGDIVKEANDLRSPSKYIDSVTGEILVRVFCSKRNGNFVTYIDEVNVSVTP
jgi:hypothetical protein